MGMEEPVPETAGRPKFLGRGLGIFFLVFGVALPAATLSYELLAHGCLDLFFDPIPTIWHALAIVLVPVSVGHAVWTLWSGRSEHAPLASRLCGASIGVSLVYTFVFLPLMPVAVIGLLFFGLGFFPLSPVLSLLCLVICQRKLRHMLPASFSGKTGLAPALAAIVLLVLLEIPGALIQKGFADALSAEASRQERGLELLRRFGSERSMVKGLVYRLSDLNLSGRILHGDNRLFGDRWISGDERAARRKVFYRVTGKQISLLDPPSLVGIDGVDIGFSFRGPSEWDRNLGGNIVGERVQGVSLKSSRQDAAIFANEAVAYLEWTLSFENSSDLQREARGLLALPAGAVVSRATLWVDGVEREAAFGSKGKAREAYERVVRQVRDPLLVTMKPGNQVLVQCFPIQPLGGTMKLRLGVSIPLEFEGESSASLSMPVIADRNFEIPPGSEHSLWIESTRAFAGEFDLPLRKERGKAGAFVLRGSVPIDGSSRVRVSRDPEPHQSELIVGDGTGESAHGIRQHVELVRNPQPARIVLVVDGSIGFQAHARELTEHLSGLPEAIDFGLIVASDEPRILRDLRDPSERGASLEALAAVRLKGGQGAVPALVEAWEMLHATGGGAVLWIHGPQPYAIHPTDPLLQRLERQAAGTSFHSVQIGMAPNMVEEGLGANAAFVIHPRRDALDASFEEDFAFLLGSKGRLRSVRTSSSESPSGVSEDAAREIRRLWAGEEVLRLIGERTRSAEQDAIRLAVAQRIVTPVSGAVVLETDPEYEQAGLETPDLSQGDEMPPVPEPSTGLLLGFGIALLAQARRRAIRTAAARRAARYCLAPQR